MAESKNEYREDEQKASGIEVSIKQTLIDKLQMIIKGIVIYSETDPALWQNAVFDKYQPDPHIFQRNLLRLRAINLDRQSFFRGSLSLSALIILSKTEDEPLADFDFDLSEVLLLATLAEDRRLVNKLIKMGGSFQKSPNGHTALHCAAWVGSIELVDSLIDHGFSIHDRTNKGLSVLRAAVNSNNLALVQHLVEAHRIDPKMDGKYKDLSLIEEAVQLATPEIVSYLILHGALDITLDINSHIQLFKSTLKRSELTIFKGLCALFSWQQLSEIFSQFSPLPHILCGHYKDQIPMIEYCLQLNLISPSDLHTAAGDGDELGFDAQTPLVITIRAQSPLIVLKYLIAKGVNYTQLINGKTVLDFAAMEDNTEALEYFIAVLGIVPKGVIKEYPQFKAYYLKKLHTEGLKKRDFLKRAQALFISAAAVLPPVIYPIIADYVGLQECSETKIAESEEQNQDEPYSIWALTLLNDYPQSLIERLSELVNTSSSDVIKAAAIALMVDVSEDTMNDRFIVLCNENRALLQIKVHKSMTLKQYIAPKLGYLNKRLDVPHSATELSTFLIDEALKMIRGDSTQQEKACAIALVFDINRGGYYEEFLDLWHQQEDILNWKVYKGDNAMTLGQYITPQLGELLRSLERSSWRSCEQHPSQTKEMQTNYLNKAFRLIELIAEFSILTEFMVAFLVGLARERLDEACQNDPSRAPMFRKNYILEISQLISVSSFFAEDKVMLICTYLEDLIINIMSQVLKQYRSNSNSAAILANAVQELDCLLKISCLSEEQWEDFTVQQLNKCLNGLDIDALTLCRDQDPDTKLKICKEYHLLAIHLINHSAIALEKKRELYEHHLQDASSLSTPDINCVLRSDKYSPKFSALDTPMSAQNDGAAAAETKSSGVLTTLDRFMGLLFIGNNPNHEPPEGDAMMHYSRWLKLGKLASTNPNHPVKTCIKFLLENLRKPMKIGGKPFLLEEQQKELLRQIEEEEPNASMQGPFSFFQEGNRQMLDSFSPAP